MNNKIENKKQFLKGQLSVVSELKEFILQKSIKVMATNHTDLAKKCTAHGVVSGYTTILQKLEVKKEKISLLLDEIKASDLSGEPIVNENVYNAENFK